MLNCGFLDSPGPLAFAHRGGGAEAIENSWGAFENARSLGFRYLETDVRATSDGVAVTVHDPAVDRVTGAHGLVRELAWPQLKTLRLGDGSGIPRLDDLLAAWPEMRWNIDVKSREAVRPVVGAIRRSGAAERILVASFSGWRAHQVRAGVGPGLATGAGRSAVALLLAAKRAPFGHLLGHLGAGACAAQVPVSRYGISIVDESFVRSCHRAGVAVHVWTIDEAAEMERLLDIGVDGIMTDRPSLLKKVLLGRGQWALPE